MDFLSLDRGQYLLLLGIGPLLMWLPLVSRRWCFTLISAAVFITALPDWKVRVALAAFMIVPLPQIWWFRTRSIAPTVVVLVTLFIWLNGYIQFNTVGNSLPVAAHILGLSYILFRQIDVLVSSSEDEHESVNVLEYIAFLTSFWTILAGPIQRYSAFLTSFRHPKPASMSDALQFLNRAINGLLKVLLFSPLLLNTAMAAAARLSRDGFEALYFAVVVYAFATYMYVNFSGYCDLVIAAAGWSGFVLPENFDKPWLSRDMIEFWNRWHITLSEWARDHMFQPLLKRWLRNPIERCPNLPQYAAIFVTFVIIGLWHGAALGWAIFGLLQGIGVVWALARRNRLQKSLGKQGYKAYMVDPRRLWLGRAICFHYVCASFLFVGFSPEDIAQWIGMV